jgi:hypothetical protein
MDCFHSAMRFHGIAWALGLVMGVAPAGALAAEPIRAKGAVASSENPRYKARLAIDGKVSDDSRWVSGVGVPAWLAVDFGAEHALAGVHVFTGYGKEDAVRDFSIEFWKDGEWREIPSAVVTGNEEVAVAVAFDQAVEVRTSKVRLVVAASHQDTARVKELVIWPTGGGDLPPLPAGSVVAKATPQEKIPLIHLNQSGFNLGKPKRFTAPTLEDGTEFVVRRAAGGDPVAKGVIRGRVGDFSQLNLETDEEFVVEAGGHVSVPFRIAPNWLERVSYQNAVNFMIDSRHYVGNDRAVCGGSFGWRDDHHFGWELHTLVAQYLSNPSAYDRLPRQVKYEEPKDKRLWGALEPYPDDAPDLVKLIHWGADVLVTQKVSHEHLKAQFAYFLYAWPMLERYLPKQNFDVVAERAFAIWSEKKVDRSYPYDESAEHDLLALKTKIGSTKGSLPPGCSVEPNLLMHEVAKRMGRDDAMTYLDAAVRQAEWMVVNLDWDEPLVTKGQRMSEWLTVTGLAHLLREYPERAPAGLKAKLEEWVRVVVRRSGNLWDFRKLDDGDGWTPMGEKPQMWNEPGNVVGLPAPLLAAKGVVEDSSLRERLDQLVWSHFDNLFGRNPVGRHFSFDAPREVEGVEHGWFRFYPGGIGRLADARFVIDGSPKNAHYPYHPELGEIGWTEGWIQFNTAFNVSLAYLAWSETKVEMTRDGDELVVRLTAPLNFDGEKVETGSVMVFSGQGDVERVEVREDGSNGKFLLGVLKLSASEGVGKAGDGVLEYREGTTVKASYGFGYLGRHTTLKP